MDFFMIVNLDIAKKIIKANEIIAIATDTLYGLCGSLFSPKSITKINSLKKRPDDKPLLVLAGSIDQVKKIADELSPEIENILDMLWPGPITVILPAKSATIAERVNSKNGSIAIRIPNHEKLRTLLNQCGPIVAPSANISGQLPCTSVEEIEAAFGVALPILTFDGFPTGQPSTIIQWIPGRWTLIREGAYKWTRLKIILGLN